jgi:hypothetical protein
MSDRDNQTERPIEVHLPSGFTLFAFKTCLVAVVISVCTLFVANWIIESVEDSTARTIGNVRAQLKQTSIGGRQFWTKIEHDLDLAADSSSDLPPEQKQKLLNDVRVIVARWRPFIDAAQSEMQKPTTAN